MNKPSSLTYLFGNHVSACVLILAFVYTCYMAWYGDGDGALAIMMAFVAAYASDCHKKLEAYRDWQIEWDAIGGTLPARRPSRRRPILHTILVGLLFNAAIAVATMFISIEDGGLFLIGLLAADTVFACLIAFRILNAFKPKAVKKPVDISVTVCLPVPRHSINYRDTYAALPSYCQRVLTPAATGSAAHSPTRHP